MQEYLKPVTVFAQFRQRKKAFTLIFAIESKKNCLKSLKL